MSYTAKVFDLGDYATLCKDYATLDAMWETVTAAYNMEYYNLTDEENSEIFNRLYEIRVKIAEIRGRLFDEIQKMEATE